MFQELSTSNEMKILLLVVGMNVTLVALHSVLFWVHERYKWQWSDRALKVVVFLMTMVSWLMAARVPARSLFTEDPKAKEESKKL